MATTPEGLVKKQVSALLKTYAPDLWFFMPVAGQFGVIGIPDFCGCYKGRMFSIETKAKGKHPTKLQEMCFDYILAAGGLPLVIRGPTTDKPQDEGWFKLEQFLNNHLIKF